MWISWAIVSRHDGEVTTDFAAMRARGLSGIQRPARPVVGAGVQRLPEGADGADPERPPPGEQVGRVAAESRIVLRQPIEAGERRAVPVPRLGPVGELIDQLSRELRRLQ